MRNVDQLRRDAIAEAYSWLNTPYVDCGYVKGERGAVDCAMLLIGIYSAIGVMPKDYDPRPYSPDWHLHQDQELYMAGLGRYSTRVDIGQPGDIAMYKYGKHASHGAILVSDTLLIHAHKRMRCVELCERRAIADKLYGYWSPFA